MHRYLLVDPIGRPDSGISSYVTNSVAQLKTLQVDARPFVRLETESLEDFRTRLARYVSALHEELVIEAPETGASTAYIQERNVAIHIRLHCSKHLGSRLQGLPVPGFDLEREQTEILRAKFVSAPSCAAVIGSRSLFKLPECIYIYPNPTPWWPQMATSEPGRLGEYVLFVGRMHTLKGANFVSELARKLPDIPFVVVGPRQSASRNVKLPPNICLANGDSWRKMDYYDDARLVIIPSIFETASMVGIEALARGKPVIAWSHLGITEYSSSVASVAPWRQEDFRHALVEMFERPYAPIDGKIFCEEINRLYLKGFSAIQEGRACNYMPVQLSNRDASIIKALTCNSIGGQMKYPYQMAPWKRKLRKLLKNPRLFFKDAWLKRAGVPITVHQLPSSPTPARSQGESNTTTMSGRVSNSAFFVQIKDSGKIQFSEPPAKPVGYITAFLYPDSRKPDADEMISGLGEFEDFRYLARPHLQLGTFPWDRAATSVDPIALIERIDVKNKAKAAAVDYFILLDPPGGLIQALRSCGSRPRCVVIVTEGDVESLDPWHVDVLIVVGKSLSTDKAIRWRRKIVVPDLHALPLAVRRAIQEGGPKNPDMLLPLIGFNGDYREELLAVDVRYFQGVLKIKEPIMPVSKNIEDMCTQLARNIAGLAVTESVYLRYHSLCQRAEDEEALASLLSYGLYDGVIFDVRS